MTMMKSINMAMSRLQGFFYWLIFPKFEPENNDFNLKKGFLMERKKTPIRQHKDFILLLIFFGANCQIF
jgi:hypothetical protein